MQHLFSSVVAIVMIAMSSMASAQSGAENQKFPNVTNVRVDASGINRFDFDVTISSPYDSPQRYADAFRVMSSLAGQSFGERKLLHDHASEQPFTRDLYGVLIPVGVRIVVIQARDQKNGYGGRSVQVILPGR